MLWRRSDGHREQGKWFCSELVTAILQAGGVLTGVSTGKMSPNTLHRRCVRQDGFRCALTVNTHIMQNQRKSLSIL